LIRLDPNTRSDETKERNDMTTTAKKSTTHNPAASVSAKKAAPAKAEAPMNRKAILARLEELGYTGPTSYLASVLRDDLLPWVAAGSPKDAANIPAGAMAHAHPTERPAKAKRLSKGYAQALSDLLEQDDPKAWAKALLAEASA